MTNYTKLEVEVETLRELIRLASRHKTYPRSHNRQWWLTSDVIINLSPEDADVIERAFTSERS